jgi:hypothetical protein
MPIRTRLSGGFALPITILTPILVCLVFLAGCNRAPSRIEAPSWEPGGYADAVLSKLDKSGDGTLDKAELAAAPGLAWGAMAIDTDKNASLSRDELVARFELYRKMRLGLSNTQMQLSYKGRPLVGAKVMLVPEFFLEEVIEPATGESITDGYVDPRIPDSDPSGLRVGYYRVVVESPKEKIPGRYSAAETTPLGFEVSPVSDPNHQGVPQLVLRD